MVVNSSQVKVCLYFCAGPASDGPGEQRVDGSEILGARWVTGGREGPHPLPKSSGSPARIGPSHTHLAPCTEWGSSSLGRQMLEDISPQATRLVRVCSFVCL